MITSPNFTLCIAFSYRLRTQFDLRFTNNLSWYKMHDITNNSVCILICILKPKLSYQKYLVNSPYTFRHFLKLVKPHSYNVIEYPVVENIIIFSIKIKIASNCSILLIIFFCWYLPKMSHPSHKYLPTILDEHILHFSSQR